MKKTKVRFRVRIGAKGTWVVWDMRDNKVVYTTDGRLYAELEAQRLNSLYAPLEEAV